MGLDHWTDSNGWFTETLSGKAGVGSISPVGAGALEMVFRGSDSHIYRTFSSDRATFGSSFEDSASTTDHQPVAFTEWSSSQDVVFYIGTNNALHTTLE